MAATEETSADEAAAGPLPAPEGAAVVGDSPGDDDGGGGEQTPAAAASDPKYCIDDPDDDSQEGFEDQPLEDEGDESGGGSVPANGGEEVVAPKSMPPTQSDATPNGTSSQEATDEPAAAAAAVAPAPPTQSSDDSMNSPSLPKRLNDVKSPKARSQKSGTPSSPMPQTQQISTVKRRKSPTSSPTNRRPSPQSLRIKTEETDGSFGPFVDPDTEWNPFGDGDVPGEMFSVDEDEQNGNAQPTGLYQRKSSSSAQQPKTPEAAEAELDGLRRVFDSEYERALEDQEISWRARFGATRLSFIGSALFMVAYLWLGCLFYASEAGWSVPDALLFTVYTVTTVGYGGPQPLPNTAAFHAFTSMYVLVGISLVTVLGAHTYQLVTLEATRMRSSPIQRREHAQDGQAASNDFGPDALSREVDKYRQQFQQELEDLVREQPLLEATIEKFKELQHYMRTTKWGRVLSVALPFLGMIFLGAIVVGTIEEWSPLESIYWSIVTLTTVGYGDYVPTRNSSVWFCTLFFIPSSLFFLSFLLAHVAKSYIRLHAIHVSRLEKRMRRKNEKQRAKAVREEKAKRAAEAAAEDAAFENENEQPATPASAKGPAKTEDVEKGFTTTVISYMEDEDLDNSPSKSSGLFGDQAVVDEGRNTHDPLSSDSSPALRYRQNVIRNKEAPPDPNGNRVVTFAEAQRSLNRHAQSSEASDESSLDTSQGRGGAKPSLDLRLRVQARLARIIAEEVAGYQTGVIIKGSTVSLTVGSLRDTADKWKIPPQAWKAFRAVAFRSLLFVGERELISDGGDALLRLNVVEFHQIFSPMLAAMGDGNAMKNWLAATDILADVELRGGAKYGKGTPVFTGTFT